MPRKRIIPILISVAVVLILGAVAWVGVVATTMSGCEGCHLQGDFRTQSEASQHRDQACSTCHGGSTPSSRVAFATSVVFSMTLPVIPSDPAVAFVPDAQCAGCHADGIASLVESDGLRIPHDPCASESSCTSCHSTVAHGTATSWPRSYEMGACLACHDRWMIEVACDSCHVGRLPADRIATGSFALTHGPDAIQNHGLGDMATCSACHQPDRCEGCHGSGVPHRGDFAADHGGFATRETADCESCHQRSFCDGCHQYDLPHPPTFLADHPSIVDDEGTAACDRCHVPQDCENCHRGHVHPSTPEQEGRLGPIPKTRQQIEQGGER